MAKRANGEGTVTKLENGKWMGRVTLGRNPDGTLNRKSLYGKTKSEVIEKMNSAKRKFEAVNRTAPANILLSEWLEVWLTTYKKIQLKPKTYEIYERFIKLHINPHIGHIKLNELHSNHIQQIINKKYPNELSSASIRKLYNIINPALEHAADNRIIPSNVAKTVKLPKHTQSTISVMTPHEQKIFLEKARDNTLYNLFVFALDTGLRLGEILALKWSDINLSEGYVSVTKNLIFVKNDDKNAKTKNILKVQDTPKTESSKRVIPLNDTSLSILTKLKIGKCQNDIVFCTSKNTYLSPRNVLRSFQNVAKKADLSNVNFHTLRHTFATRLFELDVPAKIIAEYLGHSKVAHTLDIYTHVIPAIKNEAIKRLNTLNPTNQ